MKITEEKDETLFQQQSSWFMQDERWARCWDMQRSIRDHMETHSDGSNPKDAPRKPERTWQWRHFSDDTDVKEEAVAWTPKVRNLRWVWSLKSGRNQALCWKAKTVLMCQQLFTDTFTKTHTSLLTNTKWHITLWTVCLYYTTSERQVRSRFFLKSFSPLCDSRTSEERFCQDKSVKAWWERWSVHAVALCASKHYIT